ncbi:MAG: AAA family ATPase [Piscirickettsiaceae bacterium CG_4_9_14_3_um_filter_43_564]|nr:AAA family ATPase [Thiomicrospira sp.]PIQ02614.1 MAG: AAA family ATPase [Piscirickettsiaceae bacterium CG18_big_fil_WC_8_21_14_2_50_44_103]PIX80972.1 MAG: AAA family ATPase [Piscirickettsiaceae bacterium CG_4_10_14_3_um_filter_44_349]PIY76235.1 MAG: AAA family ATPase [Piscirickettsiaceae bacterium CG_4_10_14_0_8_um_filter_44_742]PJA65855.1 MAG: AAA family ATPase [Piscirickettsiaceae bacterium CG_4_9_14_3_um_filter_43_564]
MSDFRKKIASKYILENRYRNFGACLRSLQINGFRGIDDLNITFDYPITAISGLNGAGKSTIGQLAICGYKKPSTALNYKRQYIKDFFPVSVADPNPFKDGANVVFSYETDDYKKPQDVTVSRRQSEWSGYTRQPQRHCYYIGFTVYIPKVERRDLSVYGGRDLTFTEKRELEPEIMKKMARIMGQKYEDVSFQGVSHKDRQSEIGIASRLGYSYSENNMGFGEGRILYTVDKLETSPEHSLFILEEPETSLHESAQHEFAKYLIDVCHRRHHQIILSTHSSVILNALPSDARKLLIRSEDGVDIKNRISTSQAKSILSAGNTRDLDVCVEDRFAKVLLTEVIRTKKKELLKSIAIHDIGDKNAVREAVSVLTKTGRKAIAIRDADVGSHHSEGLFSFPGSLPPEREVFSNDSVKVFIKDKFDIDIDWILDRDDVRDHHKIASCIADEVESSEDVVFTLAIEKYIQDISEQFDELIVHIEQSL